MLCHQSEGDSSFISVCFIKYWCSRWSGFGEKVLFSSHIRSCHTVCLLDHFETVFHRTVRYAEMKGKKIATLICSSWYKYWKCWACPTGAQRTPVMVTFTKHIVQVSAKVSRFGLVQRGSGRADCQCYPGAEPRWDPIPRFRYHDSFFAALSSALRLIFLFMKIQCCTEEIKMLSLPRQSEWSGDFTSVTQYHLE